MYRRGGVRDGLLRRGRKVRVTSGDGKGPRYRNRTKRTWREFPEECVVVPVVDKDMTGKRRRMSFKRLQDKMREGVEPFLGLNLLGHNSIY